MLAVVAVHRLGQTQAVDVFRLIVEDSVEDQILALQERKARLSQGALAGAHGVAMPGAASRLTLDDLKAFFM